MAEEVAVLWVPFCCGGGGFLPWWQWVVFRLVVVVGFCCGGNGQWAIWVIWWVVFYVAAAVASCGVDNWVFLPIVLV